MLLVATHMPSGATASFELRPGNFCLGRGAADDPADKLCVEFDPKLSRQHARLLVEHGSLTVAADQNRHPLFFMGTRQDRFDLFPGQRFSSGETLFELHEQTAHTITVQVMDEFQRQNPETILGVLLSLQELLSQWQEPRQLAEATVELLQRLLPGSEPAFFDGSGAALLALTKTTLRPSRSLVKRCLQEGLPAYHLWSPVSGEQQPTQVSGERWALAAPVLSSVDTLILYAVGHRSDQTPGPLARSALALVARVLGQQLEGRRSMMLAAEVEAEARANSNLRILLEFVDRTVSLRYQTDFESLFCQAAQALTGAREVRFEHDLSSMLVDGLRGHRGSDGAFQFLAASFEVSRPQGILCLNPTDQPFTQEQLDWLLALTDFAETVWENGRLHEQVQTTLEQLKDSQHQLVLSSQWAAAGRLAANAAHELNTPLGAIRLSAETALFLAPDAPAPAQDNLSRILRSVDRCRRVTDRLLSYSRPQEEKRRESFSLSEVLEDSLSTLEPLIKARKIEVAVEVSVEHTVFGDPQDCYWALTNLLKNACDALAEWEQARRIRVESTSEIDGHVRLRVDDSGPGVPEALRQKIFEPFFTTKKLGQGNGLGLSISRENLTSWGGRLELSEGSLGGAQFTLTLPTAAPRE